MIQATEAQLHALSILNREYFEKFGTMPKPISKLTSGQVGRRIRLLRIVLDEHKDNRRVQFEKLTTNLNWKDNVSIPKPDSITVTLTKDDIKQIALTMLNEYNMFWKIEEFPEASWPKVTTPGVVTKTLTRILTEKFQKGN